MVLQLSHRFSCISWMPLLICLPNSYVQTLTPRDFGRKRLTSSRRTSRRGSRGIKHENDGAFGAGVGHLKSHNAQLLQRCGGRRIEPLKLARLTYRLCSRKRLTCITSYLGRRYRLQGTNREQLNVLAQDVCG